MARDSTKSLYECFASSFHLSLAHGKLSGMQQISEKHPLPFKKYLWRAVRFSSKHTYPSTSFVRKCIIHYFLFFLTLLLSFSAIPCPTLSPSKNSSKDPPCYFFSFLTTTALMSVAGTLPCNTCAVIILALATSRNRSNDRACSFMLISITIAESEYKRGEQRQL